MPPDARLVLATAPNLRDLGGWPVAGGRRVRPGQVYRAAGLNRLHGADLAAFGQLGIRTVYDLRTAEEIARHPDVLPPGTASEVLDVLADSVHAAPADLHRILDDPTLAVPLLGGRKAEQIFTSAYREMVALPSARAAYRRLLLQLAEPDRRPSLYHCTTGKDRTGWATAVLLMLLGVGEDEVMREYLLTNAELLPALQPVLDEFAARGGDPQLLIPVLGVEPGYLEAALAEVRARHGSLDGYLRDGLGLTDQTVAGLREQLTEPG